MKWLAFIILLGFIPRLRGITVLSTHPRIQPSILFLGGVFFLAYECVQVLNSRPFDAVSIIFGSPSLLIGFSGLISPRYFKALHADGARRSLSDMFVTALLAICTAVLWLLIYRLFTNNWRLL